MRDCVVLLCIVASTNVYKANVHIAHRQNPWNVGELQSLTRGGLMYYYVQECVVWIACITYEGGWRCPIC